MEDVTCARCIVQGVLPDGRVVSTNRPMALVAQFQVRGVNTLAYHCTGCNSRAHIQQVMTASGPAWRQVHVAGNEDEWRPSHVRPGEAMQIQAAYTIGNRPSAGAPGGVGQALEIEPAFTLGGNHGPRQVGADDPMHPDNLRRSLQPVRLEEFFGR